MRQLNCRSQGRVFERAAENANFDRITVRQIDAGITAIVIALSLIHHFLWRILIAISRRPAIQLTICAAAEFQKLIPVLFHKEQQPSDGRLLLGLRRSKAAAADMDVQTAGAGLMGAIL